MFQLKKNFSVQLFLLVGCFRVTTSSNTSESQIVDRGNVFQIEEYSNEISRDQVDIVGNNSDTLKKTRTNPYRSCRDKTILSISKKTSTFNRSMSKKETALNTTNVSVERLQNLNKKHKTSEKTNFRSGTGKKKQASIVCRKSNKSSKYTPLRGSDTAPINSTKRGIGDITIPFESTLQNTYSQNPSTPSSHDEPLTKKSKYDSKCSDNMSTEINSIINTYVTPEHKGDSGFVNSAAHQLITECNPPCCVSNFENITNHGFQYYDNKTVFLTNNYTHSRVSIPTEFRDMSQCQKERHKIQIKCLDRSTKKVKDVPVRTPPAWDVFKTILISEPSLILDSPHSLAKRTPGHFCDYLFSVNKYIVHRKSSGRRKKFIGSIILEFDPVTNKIKRKTRDIENPIKIVVWCPKIEFKVPIFVPLNFLAPPNLEQFTLTMKRNAFGIIFFGEVFVSLVGDVVRDISAKFIKSVKMTCISILKFILSSEFPIYSFTISENKRLWFNKTFPITEGEYVGSMTIQKFFESLQPLTSDFNARIHSCRYKEVKDLSPDAEETFIPLYFAIDIIHKTSMSFSIAFKKIQSILTKDPKIEILDNQLDIKNEIKNMLEHLNPNWCITYHENIILKTEKFYTLISFYSFFYSEVKYVLEYWLNFGDFPLVNPDQ